MTPAEARSNTNIHKVRLFDAENLSKTAVTECWDRVKVVCTQPFNKSISYGLSFITLLTEDEQSSSNSGEIASLSQGFIFRMVTLPMCVCLSHSDFNEGNMTEKRTQLAELEMPDSRGSWGLGISEVVGVWGFQR